MLFEEDYTEEQKALLERHRINNKKHYHRIYYWFDCERLKKMSHQWQKDHRAYYRVYNAMIKRKSWRLGKIIKKKPAPASLAKQIQRREMKKRCRARKEIRITKKIMQQILMEEEKRIAENIIDEIENGKRKKTIFAIVGESGAGKTLASLHLKYKCGANVICSFTTRPPRKGEIEGRDHHFVDAMPLKNKMLAFTQFGPDGYKYYALQSQVQGAVTVYVVDEKGLTDLQTKWKDEYKIYPIYIKRRDYLKIASGVDKKRAHRDNSRNALPPETYKVIIENNGTKAEFFRKIEAIYQQLLEEAKEYGW